MDNRILGYVCAYAEDLVILGHGPAPQPVPLTTKDVNGDQLRFSVRDNGSGFDPEDRPGVRQGHFGLQGVLERVRALGGSLEIASKPGRGTRVSGTMTAPS